MKKILGIDTGGTYTDGVIIEKDSRVLLAKTKTLTTRRNLKMCIRNCIDAFPSEQLEGISMVCLSTTLATNAIVERRGCREGLILIGGRPEGKMPTERYRVIKGRPDIMGRMREMIDEHEVEEAIESFRGAVDAIAVSGYASVRNPEHEIFVKERIREKLGIPVVCAHELTTSLGFYDRTVTAVLNARLIPIICDLIDSVRSTMRAYRIDAPLMIVKGDGTLMTEECARDKPIETILSGPAASVTGGIFLSGEKDSIILDMGGTTTDLVNITGGSMRLNNEGANVGGWFTRIRAAEIYTVGLGGDSRISLDVGRSLRVGPQKVIPYCMAGAWFPVLGQELAQIRAMPEQPYLGFCRNEIEAFMVVKYGVDADRTEDERRVLEAIRTVPHTLYVLQNDCKLRNLSRILEKLIAEDVVARIALTPTDLQHAVGGYTKWNADVSRLCVEILGEQLGFSFEDCIAHVRSTIHRQLGRACICSSYYYDNRAYEKESASAIDYFIDHIFQDDRSDVLGGRFFLKKPVVAIGAPTHAWAGCLEEMLNTRVIVPPHAEVANAVGAAVGQAVDTAEILIRFDPVNKRYTLFSQECRQTFDTLEEATENAEQLGRRLAVSYLPGDDIEISCAMEDVCTNDHFSGGKRLAERYVRVTAVSRLSGSPA